MCMPGSVEWDSYCNRRKVKSSLWQQKRLPWVLDTEEALCPDSASLSCTKVFAPYVSWYIGLESFGQMAHKVQIGSSEPFSPLTALRNTKGQKFSPILCGDFGLETPCHHLHAPTHFPKASGISEVWCWKEKKKGIHVSPLCFHFLCALSWLLLIQLLPLDWTGCKYKREKKRSWLHWQARVRIWKRVACVVSEALILQTLLVIVPTLNVCHTIHSWFHHLLTQIKYWNI